MGTFDRFINKAMAAGQVAGQKANELVEVTKLNLAIAQLETEIEECFQAIGQMVYETYKDNETSAEELNEKCQIIDSKKGELAQLRQKVNALRNVKQCQSCGEINEKENIYCSKCGEKLEDQPKEHIVVDDYVVAEDAPKQEEN